MGDLSSISDRIVKIKKKKTNLEVNEEKILDLVKRSAEWQFLHLLPSKSVSFKSYFIFLLRPSDNQKKFLTIASVSSKSLLVSPQYNGKKVFEKNS